MDVIERALPEYSKKDFASDQAVRWCPGCGDYSVLAAIQKALPGLKLHREKFVFISGIGCSSRFPYYMNTYGFHTIHGRAPAIATGTKIMNPDLSVWVVTGDGDSLSIGGNHTIHVLRRNVDLNIILFNNEIYGLTKGQYSPTSQEGVRTKSTPYGSIDSPLHPLKVAISADASFVARSADLLVKHQGEVYAEAYEHRGTSYIEVMQNCHIFNDGAFKPILDKTIRDERLLMLEDGKPMLFGKEQEKGIALNPNSLELEVIENIADNQNRILIHNASAIEPNLHFMLANMSGTLPTAMGVIRKIKRPTYEELMYNQEADVFERKGEGDLMAAIYGKETWTVS